jgi:hypothetical protein
MYKIILYLVTYDPCKKIARSKNAQKVPEVCSKVSVMIIKIDTSAVLHVKTDRGV